MVTLIHNVLTTDYVALVHDDHCVMGLKVLHDGLRLLEKLLRLGEGFLELLGGLFGISSICNIVGSIRTAKFLNLSRKDNVVTIATDGFDRYPSVLADLERRKGPITNAVMLDWFEEIFRGAAAGEILDLRPGEQKERLFRQKEEVWSRFGYSAEYLNRMKSTSFWETEYDHIRRVDEQWKTARSL